MSVTLENILEKMKSGSAESDFIQKLSAAETAQVTPDTTPAPTVESDEAKLAAALDEEGRIFARSFYDELNKIALEKQALNPPTGITPNRPAIQQSMPAIQNSVLDDARAGEVDKVVAILNSLVGNPTMPATKMEVGPFATPSAAAPSPVYGQQVSQAEMTRAKEESVAQSIEAGRKVGSAHNDVVSALYAHYFGGNR